MEIFIKEAQEAYDIYKRYKEKGITVKRCEYVICSAYIDYLHLIKGYKTAMNHFNYAHKGDKERKDEMNIAIRELNLS